MGDRVAIVTGGSRGLGAALCELYAGQGWRVVEFSRTAPHAFSVRADLGEPWRAAQVFDETLSSFVGLEFSEVVGIGNAAVLGPVGPVERTSAQEVAAHLQVNVISAILFARAFVAVFQTHRCTKTFVNISSGAASGGVAGWSLYCCSKAALENYVRAVAREQSSRPQPIRALSVNPGVMDTAMQEVVRGSEPEDFPALERFLQYQRDGLLTNPDVVASQIAELVESRPEPGEVYPLPG